MRLLILLILCFSSTIFASLPPFCSRNLLEGDSLFELTRNIKPEQIALLHPTRKERDLIVPLRDALYEGDWHYIEGFASAERLESLVRAAYALVSAYKITVDQFATLLWYWEAVSDLPYHLERIIYTKPLLTKAGALTEDAKNLFLEYSTKSEAELIQSIELLSESEKYYWVFEYPLSHEDLKTPLTVRGGRAYEKPAFAKLMAALLDISTFQPLYKTEPPGKRHTWYKIPVLSMGLVRTLGDLRFGQNALKPLVQIGEVPSEQILQQILRGERTFGFKFPDITEPEKIHGVESGKFPYTYHDFFHLFQGSETSKKDREFFINTYSKAQNANPTQIPLDLFKSIAVDAYLPVRRLSTLNAEIIVSKGVEIEDGEIPTPEKALEEFRQAVYPLMGE